MFTRLNRSRVLTFLGLAAIATGVLASARSAYAQPSYAILHSFNYLEDGSEPFAGLIQAPDGTLYGTTQIGGVGPCAVGAGCGTVFQAPDGSGFAVLHSFGGEADGQLSYAGRSIRTTWTRSSACSRRTSCFCPRTSPSWLARRRCVRG